MKPEFGFGSTSKILGHSGIWQKNYSLEAGIFFKKKIMETRLQPRSGEVIWVFAMNELMSEILNWRSVDLKLSQTICFIWMYKSELMSLKFMPLLQNEPTIFFAAASFLVCQPDLFVVRYRFRAKYSAEICRWLVVYNRWPWPQSQRMCFCTAVMESKDGTISVASAFAAHQEGENIAMVFL